MSTTPSMGMTLPDVSVTPGPTYASEINAAMNVVDGHDHTPGFGVRVPAAGININADLPFGGFNATGLLTTAYNNQSAHPSGNTRVYFKGGELYATDGSGNHVQLTLSGNVNVGSVGAITGMGGTSATVSYSNVTKTFTFNQAANQTALMKVGDVTITDSSVTSGNSVTVKAPAGLAGSYTLTAPGALPGSTLPISMSSAGALSTGQITTAQITDANVTRPKLVAVGQQVSSNISFSSSATTTTAITNATITITTTGRPVRVFLQSNTTTISGTPASVSYYSNSTSSGSAAPFCALGLSRDGGSTFVGTVAIGNQAALSGASLQGPRLNPTAAYDFVDIVGAGTYTYQLYMNQASGASTLAVSNCVLVAYEL